MSSSSARWRRGRVSGMASGDEHDAAVGQALQEATGSRGPASRLRRRSLERRARRWCLGSGNLGLDLSDGGEAAPDRRGDRASATRACSPRSAITPHRLSARSLGRARTAGDQRPRRAITSPTAASRARTRSLRSPPTRPPTFCRTDGFEHVADIMVGSFYDPELEEGCAFEELISFHGGLGGPQTRPFVLHPTELPVPAEPIVGRGRRPRVAHRLADACSQGEPASRRGRRAQRRRPAPRAG